MPLAVNAETEVRALHEFIESWFAGRLHADEFEHPPAALADDFVMVTPRSDRRERGAVLDTIRDAHAAKAESVPPFEVDIEGVEVRDTTEDRCLIAYEEWQREDGEATGRRSTALLRRSPDAPNGVEWVHVHETWIPEND